VTGATELAPKMTVLQVVAWLAYLAVVIPAFVRAGRTAAAARAAAAGTSAAPAVATATLSATRPAPQPEPVPRRWNSWPAAGPGPWPGAGRGPGGGGGRGDRRPSRGQRVRHHGRHGDRYRMCEGLVRRDHGTADVHGDQPVQQGREVNLDNAAGAVVAEIETLGPARRRA